MINTLDTALITDIEFNSQSDSVCFNYDVTAKNNGKPKTLNFEVRRRIHERNICFDVYVNGVTYQSNVKATDAEFDMWSKLRSIESRTKREQFDATFNEVHALLS